MQNRKGGLSRIEAAVNVLFIGLGQTERKTEGKSKTKEW
jgi:hypothetical protein